MVLQRPILAMVGPRLPKGRLCTVRARDLADGKLPKRLQCRVKS